MKERTKFSQFEIFEETRMILPGHKPFVCSSCLREHIFVVSIQFGRDLPSVCMVCADIYNELENVEW